MTDIVKRLRLIEPKLELRHEDDVTRLHEIGLWCDEAADEIERLREALHAIYKHQRRMPNIDATIWELTRTALREKE